MRLATIECAIVHSTNFMSIPTNVNERLFDARRNEYGVSGLCQIIMRIKRISGTSESALSSEGRTEIEIKHRNGNQNLKNVSLCRIQS